MALGNAVISALNGVCSSSSSFSSSSSVLRTFRKPDAGSGSEWWGEAPDEPLNQAISKVSSRLARTLAPPVVKLTHYPDATSLDFPS